MFVLILIFMRNKWVLIVYLLDVYIDVFKWDLSGNLVNNKLIYVENYVFFRKFNFLWEVVFDELNEIVWGIGSIREICLIEVIIFRFRRVIIRENE